MSSPTPGSTLTTTSATFNWTTGSGASSYWLYVGSNGAGSANILKPGRSADLAHRDRAALLGHAERPADVLYRSGPGSS